MNYDVIAVDNDTDTVRILDTGKTKENAEATVNMAVMRRGCDEEFFVAVKAGMYAGGEKYTGNGIDNEE